MSPAVFEGERFYFKSNTNSARREPLCHASTVVLLTKSKASGTQQASLPNSQLSLRCIHQQPSHALFCPIANLYSKSAYLDLHLCYNKNLFKMRCCIHLFKYS